jgi:SagB-type dehydrogenase family enzyme
LTLVNLTGAAPEQAGAMAVNPLGIAGAMMLAMAAPQARPAADEPFPLDRALKERRSVREFSARALSLEELARLAWAAQGVVTPRGQRTAPSAGALYPLELHVVAGNVQGLEPGVYRYEPSQHRFDLIAGGDRRQALVDAAKGQAWLGQAAAVFVFAAVERRITPKYGERGVRYMHMEAGHAAQNLLLQAVALGLGAAPVGAFSDKAVHSAAALPRDAQTLYLIPVGRAPDAERAR